MGLGPRPHVVHLTPKVAENGRETMRSRNPRCTRSCAGAARCDVYATGHPETFTRQRSLVRSQYRPLLGLRPSDSVPRTPSLGLRPSDSVLVVGADALETPAPLGPFRCHRGFSGPVSLGEPLPWSRCRLRRDHDASTSEPPQDGSSVSTESSWDSWRLR